MAWDDFSAFKRLSQWPVSLAMAQIGGQWILSSWQYLFLQVSPHIFWFVCFLSLWGHKTALSRCFVGRKCLYFGPVYHYASAMQGLSDFGISRCCGVHSVSPYPSLSENTKKEKKKNPRKKDSLVNFLSLKSLSKSSWILCRDLSGSMERAWVAK